MRTETDEFSFILKPSEIPGAGVGVFANQDINADSELRLFPEPDYRGLKEKYISLIENKKIFEDPTVLKIAEEHIRFRKKDDPILKDDRARSVIENLAVDFGEFWLCPKSFNRPPLYNYLNHSKDPNIGKLDLVTFYAIKDIKAGDELTLNYGALSDAESENDIVF
jgi:SET domain-containing protein